MTIYSSDALRPIAGHTYVPDSMEARGDPVPLPPFPGVTNGDWLPVRAGTYGLDWKFPTLTMDEMAWWKTLIGYVSGDENAINAKRFTLVAQPLPAARLWDITGTMVDYKVAVVHMPIWARWRNGYFHDCIVQFRGLVEL